MPAGTHRLCSRALYIWLTHDFRLVVMMRKEEKTEEVQKYIHRSAWRRKAAAEPQIMQGLTQFIEVYSTIYTTGAWRDLLRLGHFYCIRALLDLSAFYHGLGDEFSLGLSS